MSWRSPAACQHYKGLYWGYIGIMEKKMETTIVFRGYIGIILGLYRDNGKEHGNYYVGFRV